MANDSKMTAFGPKSRYGLIHDVFGITPADQKLEPSYIFENIHQLALNEFSLLLQSHTFYL